MSMSESLKLKIDVFLKRGWLYVWMGDVSTSKAVQRAHIKVAEDQVA